MKLKKVITLSAIALMSMGTATAVAAPTAQAAVDPDATCWWIGGHRPDKPSEGVHGSTTLPGTVDQTWSAYFDSENYSDVDAANANPGNIGLQTINPSDTDHPEENNGMPYQTLNFSGSHQFMTKWINSGYKMDFSHNFTGVVYINFGDDAKKDGFTFTLQNDPAGSKAMTKATSSKDGENLGVAGRHDLVPSLFNVKYANEYAVQNSMSIGFDLYQNNERLNNHMFDYKNCFTNRDLTTNHMAYVYGADKKSYDYTSFLTGNQAVLKHNDPINLNKTVSTNVRDNTWYKFSYGFGDINKDGKEEFYYTLSNPTNENKHTKTVMIPATKLFQELNLKNNDYKAFWGFTAANGGNSGYTKVTVGQMPTYTTVSKTR